MMKRVFFVLLMFVLAVALCGCEGDTISAPESNPMLDLVSNPLGATVKIFQPDMSKADNVLGTEIFSGITPVYGRELEAGSYIVEVSADGYDTKFLGLSLMDGVNVSETVSLALSPVDPPEYEAVTASLAFSSSIIALGDTVNVTPTMTNGALGILSMGGHQYFTEVMSPVFPFTPTQSGEQLVSFLAIGEGGDFKTCNRYLTVLAEPEAVALNAWIIGSDTVLADTEVRFGWASSANADSVTVIGYYTDGNIGLNSPESSLVILQDHVVTFYVWKDGEIKDTESLEFFVQPPVPQPTPELSFFASSDEIENDNPMWSDHLWSDGEIIFIIWNVTHHNDLTDEVSIDRMSTYGDLGPRGLIPVTVSSDTTFTMTVRRDGQEVISKMVRIFWTEGPVEQPDFIRLGWSVDVWVGQRLQDPHEADLMSSIYLPANLQAAVSAQLEYSPVSAGQNDETCRFGFLSPSGEHWAYPSGSDDSFFPDQGEDINELFFIGNVVGFSDEEGRMVIQAGEEEGKCTNPNSVHCSWVELEIELP